MTGWSSSPLGQIVAYSGGAIQTGPFGSQLHASDYRLEGTPLVMPLNMGDNVIGESGIARIGAADVRRLSKHRLRAGDIVFSRRGNIGRRAIVRPEQDGWLCGTGCLAVKFGKHRSNLNPEFVALAVGTARAQAWLLDNAVGGTMLNLNTSILSGLPIQLPCKATQDWVVDALSSTFEQVVALDELIAKKRDIKQGMMQELFTGKARLPGFAGDWEIRKVGGFADVKAGGTPSTAIPRYWGGEIRWMSSGEIHKKRVWDVSGRISREGLRESSAQLLPEGTVLMALAGQGKTRGTVAVSRVELTTNQSIAGILPSDEHDSDFLYYNLDTRYDELRGESAGDGGRGGLNLTIIKKLDVLMPPPEEQAAMAHVLMDVDDEIAALERRRRTARAIKTGMMQDFFTGRFRLPAEVAT